MRQFVGFFKAGDQFRCARIEAGSRSDAGVLLAAFKAGEDPPEVRETAAGIMLDSLLLNRVDLRDMGDLATGDFIVELR